ncbi:MAG: ABC transporter ATP-binding protein [Betaproteobacteria bacterium]|nr:ABC transporter ATP-binding protein [Betaproteobacteria bacterium]
MIEARGIHVSIGGSLVLGGVSVSVAPGSLVAVIGANGAGKTTLLRTLSCLLPLGSGEIHFNGKRIDAMAPHLVARSGLVHVPQGRQVIPHLSVEENLLIGAQQLRGLTRSARAESLEREYLRFPVLRDRRRVFAGALSGGEQQMLAISRGLMMQPKLLMLDEPSLGLAPKVAKNILAVLRDLANGGVAVLLVEQAALSALTVADFALVMQGGRIVLEGSGSDLLTDPGLVKSFLG